MFDELPTRQPYDTLADLLLGGPVEQIAPKLKLTPPDSRPLVEAVIPAALPGMDDPWISQYAQHFGREMGGVALVRDVGDHLHLELIESTESVALSDTHSPTHNIIDSLRPDVGGWIIKASVEDAPLLNPRRWVVLCGAAQEERLRGYQCIKHLVHHGAQGEIGLMLAGCESTEAKEAAERLCRTAKHCLGRSIHFIGSRQQIEPVQRQIVARLDGAMDQIRLQMAQQLGITRSPLPHHNEAIETECRGLHRFIENTQLIDITLPHANQVEVGMDDVGRLHLLARAGENGEPAALALLRALAWIRRHRDELPPDAQTTHVARIEPALHLFTENPKSCAMLRWVGEPETPVRLHLLRDVNSFPNQGLVHVEL